MPTTLPGLSVTKAAELLQIQDRIIKSFPEVESVYGKAGRALTATDPAPMEMFETIINLRPKGEWRSGITVDDLKARSEEHTSELQSLIRSTDAVFCLKKKNTHAYDTSTRKHADTH